MGSSEPGKLRIYLGSAAGVGKTYAMLCEGHRRVERGTDVVIGFVETHRRSTPPNLSRDWRWSPGPGCPTAAPSSRRWTSTRCSFQRLGDTDNTTGVGLGLALSRGLIEVLHGTLEPEETPGGGLTMIISLPAAEAGRAVNAPGQRERDETAGAH